MEHELQKRKLENKSLFLQHESKKTLKEKGKKYKPNRLTRKKMIIVIIMIMMIIIKAKKEKRIKITQKGKIGKIDYINN